MLTYYHVRMPDTWAGPGKVVVRLSIGGAHSPISFKRTETDKSSPYYPSKTLWLDEQSVLQLKKLGFDLRKAKQPEAEKKQIKPKKKGDN